MLINRFIIRADGYRLLTLRLVNSRWGGNIEEAKLTCNKVNGNMGCCTLYTEVIDL